jgi:eukaryotic-like serine/threonine-protein kinase
MTGDDGSRVQPLRSTDPTRVGGYRLLGRLGEGGMGSVYLALHPDGRTVAVKLIRVDRAGDDEFRRRFRGEVKRARQVPPFCTAEVLDADPDHDPPYLVVEYVDGPSLTAVVAERGPLTTGNLHGLAIGVATALTAIHGAGVIHRDLKPSNVLLPPGTPKVIDFGIARAAFGTDLVTDQGQVIGTVAYMAPERFDAAADATLTPAADVFAWGAVVAFAGTARTPFGGDTPEITAVRIMTQEPDLGGLEPPLRDLVAQALAKDPAARPTARELLDALLGGGAPRPGEAAAEFASQPALLAAAEQAKAATDQRPVPETARAAGRPATTTQVLPPAVPSPRIGADAAVPPAVQPAATAAPAGAGGWSAPPAGPPPPVQPHPYPYPPPAPAPVDRWGRVTAALLALVVLVGALVGLGFLTGVLPLERGTAQSPPNPSPTAGAPTSAPTSAAGSATASAPVTFPPTAFRQVVGDPLTEAGVFQAKNETGAGLGECAFKDGLVVTTPSYNSYRCQGPQETLADVRVDVDVRLLTADSCGAIWLRYSRSEGGYAVRMCADKLQVLTHGVPGIADVTTLRTFRYPGARTLAPDESARVRVDVVGDNLRAFLDDRPLGAMALQPTLGAEAAPAPTVGRVHLGVFPFSEEGTPPTRVSFADITIYTGE